jgi:hypothetical protein
MVAEKTCSAVEKMQNGVRTIVKNDKKNLSFIVLLENIIAGTLTREQYGEDGNRLLKPVAVRHNFHLL